MDIVSLIILPALVSAILCYAITPFVIKFAWKFGLIDDPKINHHPKVIHTIPTPRGGGLAIFMAIVIASAIFLQADIQLIAIMLGAFGLVVMGILDDKYNLSPYVRLIAQFALAAVPVAAGVGIAFLTSPTGGTIDLTPIMADLFAIFWIVGLMNFLNMGAKAVPGQLSGVVAIAFATVALLSLEYSADLTEWPVTILAAISMGAFLGFLPWHAFPQKIMPSFSGSMLAGYMLGVLSILSTAKVGTVMVVLAVPLIDTGYTIIRRVMSGKSPVWGDRGHLHHKLMDKFGFSQFQVALFYWGITALLGILALNLDPSFKLYTIIGVAGFIGGLLLWLTYRSK
jgi:UDP-GlcNAc:undecaprenyl-phosphate GlcNAc-1-phosphate transferase